MILTVPVDKAYYPTLGPLVCDWIEENLVFGPGDLRGNPATLDDEKRALIYRMYELFPKGHPQEGRRRFRRVGVSLPKGLAKTELAAWLAACELHPGAPVRFAGWAKNGEPIGRSVTDPYIPLVAYTEEQSDELAYGALRAILEESPIAGDFDIGLERIMRRGGDGKAVSLSSSPNARDGARTTFAVSDETHWWVLPRLKQAHQTMLNNTVKRKIADPWVLEITTAPEPGTGSVAEATMDYALAVHEGRIKDSTLFYFHRQAGDEHDLTTEEGARAAVIEASGPAAVWRDIDGIVGIWRDPTTDRAFWERVWCNRLVKGYSQAFDINKWKALEVSERPRPGDEIVLGFDGGVSYDSTGLVATHLATGLQWVVGAWERPPNAQEWQVPHEEVEQVVAQAFEDYTVRWMYADPPYWQPWLKKWAGTDWGHDRIVEQWTNRRRWMTFALNNFDTAIKTGQIHHDGDKRLTRHIANARRKDLIGEHDEQGKALWLIQKERADSPHKIDLAMAAVLSWVARTDAVANPATQEPQLMFLGAGR